MRETHKCAACRLREVILPCASCENWSQVWPVQVQESISASASYAGHREFISICAAARIVCLRAEIVPTCATLDHFSVKIILTGLPKLKSILVAWENCSIKKTILFLCFTLLIILCSYLRMGLSKRDAVLLDELIASKDINIPENPEDILLKTKIPRGKTFRTDYWQHLALFPCYPFFFGPSDNN